jgi:hypothetical protein
MRRPRWTDYRNAAESFALTRKQMFPDTDGIQGVFA